MRLKNIISKENDLTVQIPDGVTPNQIDLVVLKINEHLDEMDSDLMVLDKQCNALECICGDVYDLSETHVKVREHIDENPEYEGLDVITVEEIHTRLTRLTKRRGIPTDTVRGVFSQESFKGLQGQALKRKTEISLEGLGSFLRGVWEKIKAAIRAVWEGIKNFWKKHFTILGSLEAELKKLKKEVQNKKGYPNFEKVLKPDSKLVKTFRPSGNLTSHDVSKVTKVMDDANLKCTKYLNQTFKYMESKFLKEVTKRSRKEGEIYISEDAFKTLSLDRLKFGTKENPLAGGVYGEFEIEGDAEAGYTIKFEWHEADDVRDVDRNIQLASRDECEKLIDQCIKVVDGCKVYGKVFNEQFDKTQRMSNKLTNAVENIREPQEDKERKEAKTTVGSGGLPMGMSFGILEEKDHANASEIKKEYQQNLRFFQHINSMLPKLNNRLTKLNIDTVRSTVKFIKQVMSALEKKPSDD